MLLTVTVKAMIGQRYTEASSWAQRRRFSYLENVE